jgi:hypothetical protein
VSKHCGCQRQNPKLKVGDIYRHWKIIEILSSTRSVRHQRWRVSCIVCNETRIVVHNILFNTKKHHCGCQNKKNNIQIGDMHGFWKIIGNIEDNYVECLCTGCSSISKKIEYGSLLRNETRSCGCKERELYRQTLQLRYGIDSPLQSLDFQQKREKTTIEKYGAKYFTQSEEGKAKVKQTNQMRFGFDAPTQHPDIKHKAQLTRRKNQNSHPLLSNQKTIRHYCQEAGIVNYSHALLIFREQGEEAFLRYCDNYTSNIYSTESALVALLSSHVAIEKYDKFPLEFNANRKPDFRLEENNKILYVNIDGLYWHSEKEKDDKYHFDLQESFKNNNQVIFQFREDELRDKPLIVKSIILNHLGMSETRIFARKCIIKKVDSPTAQQFLLENHLMGPTFSKGYGLYYNNTLVCLMTFKKKGKGLDISRFCNKLGHSVVGGFSKLLKHIIKEFSPSFIQSFLDLRYSTGASYERCGFKLEKIHLSWKWTDGKETFNRLSCKANMDKRRLSQKEYAKELGWYKIYDAGQAKFILDLNIKKDQLN